MVAPRMMVPPKAKRGGCATQCGVHLLGEAQINNQPRSRTVRRIVVFAADKRGRLLSWKEARVANRHASWTTAVMG